MALNLTDVCGGPIVKLYGRLTQWLECLVYTEGVGGSNPSPTTLTASGTVDARLLLHGGVAQLVEHLLCKQDVAGSIPVTSTLILEN